VLNEVIRLSTNNTISTLIIRPTNPRVRKLSGKVSNLRSIHTVAFTMPRITATSNAARNPSTVTPGTIYAATNTEIAEIIRLIMNDMCLSLTIKDIPNTTLRKYNYNMKYGLNKSL
jgi:hypothetical protein